MARPKLAVPSVEKNISIPEDLALAVDLELFSDVEGKVPFGAWKGFIARLIRQHLERRRRADALAEKLEALRKAEGDRELRHQLMDDLLCAELEALGYGKAVTLFRQTPRGLA